MWLGLQDSLRDMAVALWFPLLKKKILGSCFFPSSGALSAARAAEESREEEQGWWRAESSAPSAHPGWGRGAFPGALAVGPVGDGSVVGFS